MQVDKLPSHSQRLPTPPLPRGSRFFGHMPQMARDPLTFLTEAVGQHGDMIMLALGGPPSYLAAHPDQLKQILQEEYQHYGKDPRVNKLRVLLGDGLFTSEDATWLSQRRLMQPAFHRQQIAALAGSMVESTAVTVDRWQNAAIQQTPLDIVHEMMLLTQRIAVSTLFGMDISDRGEQVVQAVEQVMHQLGGFTKSLLPTFIPTPRRIRFRRALRMLDALMYQIIDERRRSNLERPDLLTLLLNARDAETGTGMTDRQLRDELMTLFVGGHETTMTTLAWAWYLLGQHPAIEAKLHAELDEVLSGRAPTVEDLSNLPYTRMIIDEVLRLYPASWLTSRRARVPGVLGGYTIPAGSIVFISSYVTHRHPAFWEQPDVFDPERFHPERATNRPRFAYFPFGGGPRLCIGNHFALMEAHIALAMIAQRYVLRLIPGQVVKPHPGLTLRPKGLMMRAQSREIR
jgi:cytochrome P450